MSSLDNPSRQHKDPISRDHAFHARANQMMRSLQVLIHFQSPTGLAILLCQS